MSRESLFTKWRKRLAAAPTPPTPGEAKHAHLRRCRAIRLLHEAIEFGRRDATDGSLSPAEMQWWADNKRTLRAALLKRLLEL